MILRLNWPDIYIFIGRDCVDISDKGFDSATGGQHSIQCSAQFSSFRGRPRGGRPPGDYESSDFTLQLPFSGLLPEAYYYLFKIRQHLNNAPSS